METQQLREALEELAKKTDGDLRTSLSKRKTAELEFFDEYRDEKVVAKMTAEEYKKVHGAHKYYETARLSHDYELNWIREHSRGKILLDYACGNGELTFEAARAGAELAIGLDISRVSVENCRQKAAELGLGGNTYFLQGDCENTGLPDNSVDVVLCFGMLHHLDLSYCFPELRRIMKPGSMCFCTEALNCNPIFKVYRKLTPEMRTEWEAAHILSVGDLAFAKRFFEVTDVRYWHLLSLAATPFRNTRFFEHMLAVANALDSAILRIPLIARMAWQFSFVLVKRQES